jgi:hypothetical protein
VVLPTALGGIVTGIMVGVARIIIGLLSALARLGARFARVCG